MENDTNRKQDKPILDVHVATGSAITETSKLSVNALAVLMGVLLVAALVFVVMHLGSILVIGLNVLFGAIAGASIGTFKPLKRFGARPAVNSAWTFLLVIAVAVALICARGTNAVALASLLIALRLVMSPDKPKATMNKTRTETKI